MSTYAYDIDNWLLSASRSLKEYVQDKLRDDNGIGTGIDVEMSFPDTSSWKKPTPLKRALVHLELDDMAEMKTGFGVLKTHGDITVDDEVLESEAHCHHLNYDVGIWTSAETGGTTKRMQIRQALVNLFGTATGRLAFTEATDGLQVVSFDGGTDLLDRINEVPFYRTMNSTLVISVFGRLSPETLIPVLVEPGDQNQKLSIEGEDGELEHITTIEEPWS